MVLLAFWQTMRYLFMKKGKERVVDWWGWVIPIPFLLHKLDKHRVPYKLRCVQPGID